MTMFPAGIHTGAKQRRRPRPGQFIHCAAAASIVKKHGLEPPEGCHSTCLSADFDF